MNQKVSEVKAAVRYSEAYKLAVVREVESGVARESCAEHGWWG